MMSACGLQAAGRAVGCINSVLSQTGPLQHSVERITESRIPTCVLGQQVALHHSVERITQSGHATESN